MTLRFLTTHLLPILLASIASMFLSVGCGSESNAKEDGDGNATALPTVTTGSLSKTAFVKRADAICEATRSRFGEEYEAFLKDKAAASSPEKQAALLGEAVDTILVPDYEKAIEAIAALGAPKGDRQEVTSFLEALQGGFTKMHERPQASFSNTYFERAVDLGTRYGLTGCVQSLS